MKSTSTAPFQSPSGDFDPALLLLNLRNKDDGDSSDELRRASSQASSGPVSHAATENDDFVGASFTRESSFASSDTCTCKKSRCLKKYCQCFASNAVCNQHCRCIECENTSFDNPPRKRAIEELLIRNPTAFVPKIKVDTAITVDEDVIQQTSHRVGCRCRKSMCLKKYCECYQGGVLCTTICTCLDCRNKGDGPGLDDAMLTNDGQMDMEVSLVKAKIIKKQTSFTKKRPLSFLEEESPVCANYDTAKFFPEDGAMPAFAAALHSAANGPLSMATSGAVGNPTSLLSANLMKHALSSSSSSSSSSGPTASSSTLTRNNTFPLRPSHLTADHHEQDMKRMKSLSAFEAAAAASSSSSSSASHMQHSTPIANKTPLSSSSSQSRTTRATSNSLETPRNNPNISPQSWSIAQAFYRLGDEFAAKQQRNGSLLLTDEQRKAIRLSMSSSISTEGREAIAESVLRTLRFSAENFFQQFSETTPEAAQAEKVAIADKNSNCNDATTRRASAYAAAAGASSSSSTRSMLMDVDEADDTNAAATAPGAPSTQKKPTLSTANQHRISLTEEEDEEAEEEEAGNTTAIVAQRARALSEASAKENTDPSSVTQTASAMREIQVTDYKSSPFAGKHHHQSKRLVHRKGSRTTATTTTTTTKNEQHQNKRRRRNSTGSHSSAHDDSETEAEDDDNLSDDGERLRRRSDSINDDDDKDDDVDDDASTEDERDNDFDGEGEDRERRYLKKMAAKQRAVQAALDAAAMALPPVAVSD